MAFVNPDLLRSPPKALTFDIFGTVVNWRETVTTVLVSSAASKVFSSSRSADLSPSVRQRLSELDDGAWGKFAQEWRNSYTAFVRGYNPERDPWIDIDTHHRRSLEELLRQWGLEGLYNEDELDDLSQVWHFLDPWPDSASGLQKLGAKFITSTLSNGNQSLLKDLTEHGHLGFQLLQSSEDFRAYKPHSSVYLGAVDKMALKPEEVAMVAAHLVDLKAARNCGLKTIYVERRLEEEWEPSQEEYQAAKRWVDVWITQSQEGLVEIAKIFEIK